MFKVSEVQLSIHKLGISSQSVGHQVKFFKKICYNEYAYSYTDICPLEHKVNSILLVALHGKFGSVSSWHSKKDLVVTGAHKHTGQEFYSDGKRMLRGDKKKAINTDAFISNAQH